MNYTFYTFLKELKQNHGNSPSLLIEVPYIQRDYVQGRKWENNPDAQARRDEFILALLKSLLKDEKPLIIDFIYGYISPNNSFVPLDGQQRLTTLFLLHWLLNYAYGKIHPDNAEKYKEQMKLLSGFGYVTRASSQHFCRNLTGQPILLPDDDKYEDVYDLLAHIDDVIKNQSWYAANSDYDPTVQAMLQMLVAIGEFLGKAPFRDKIDEMLEMLYCEPEQEESARGIVFDKLDIHDLHQTDELYIKMNARGKQLTPFENEEFLKRWAAKREECFPSSEDDVTEEDEEAKREKRKQYDLWRYGYPLNDAEETSERIRMLQKRDQLKKELDEINRKLESGEDI